MGVGIAVGGVGMGVGKGVGVGVGGVGGVGMGVGAGVGIAVGVGIGVGRGVGCGVGFKDVTGLTQRYTGIAEFKASSCTVNRTYGVTPGGSDVPGPTKASTSRLSVRSPDTESNAVAPASEYVVNADVDRCWRGL